MREKSKFLSFTKNCVFAFIKKDVNYSNAIYKIKVKILKIKNKSKKQIFF